VTPGTALRAACVAREERGEEQSPFHRITEFCYPSGAEMKEALTSEDAQETTARTASISAGDPPIVLFSNNEMLTNILAAPCTQRLALLLPKKAPQGCYVCAL
jgi:hypothetical protein